MQPIRRRAAYPFSCLCLLASSLAGVVACSDDSDPAAAVGGSGGTSGAAGATAGRGGSSGSGTGGSGTAGSGGTGTGGSGGSAGSGGSSGSGGTNTDAGVEPGDSGDPDNDGSEAFVVSSPAFANNPGCGPGAPANAQCALFPDENTNLGDAANTSPVINWTGVPIGTQSFAIALHDLSNVQGGGDTFTHWVMWNIPGSETGLPAGLPPGVMPGTPTDITQQVSIGGDSGYVGSGRCGNVYEFVLYALDAPTFAPSDTGDPDAVQTALDDSDAVLATARMRARSDPAGPSCN